MRLGLDGQQRQAVIMVALVLGSIGAGALVVYAAGHLSNTAPVNPPVPVHAPNGPAVTINESADVNMTDMYPASDTVEIVSSKGNLTANGSQFANVTVESINGTWTNTTDIDVVGKTLTMDPGDKEAVTVTGDITALEWRQSMATDDATVDFTYTSSLGSRGVTLNGLPSNTQMAAIDADNNEVLDVASSDMSGQVTFSGLNSGSHDVLLQTSANGPAVADRSPSDGALLDSTQVTLEANVSDPDLPADNVTIEWYVDSSLEATESIQSNQTVSHSTTISLGGSHTWHMELEDAYGNTLTTSTFTMDAPSNLSIRKELDPDSLVTDAEVHITAYYSGEVQRRSTTNGNVSLENFPVDEPIIVRANASNYTTRTAVIEDIFEQNSMYLLNDSKPTYLARFDLQDPTGDYPRADTVLFVERDLNQSGSVGWKIIAGDNFGVQGVPVDLAQDERYRLRIRNLETGDTAVVGAYTAIQSETVVVTAPSEGSDPPDIERDYYWEFTKNDTVPKITFEYVDEAEQTTEIKLTIHERYNASNVLVDNETFTNTNDLTYDKALTGEQANTTWIAQLYVDRGGGLRQFTVPVDGGPVSIIPSNLDQAWVQGIGVFVLLITGMAFSQLNQGVGAITTAIVGGMLYWVGILTGAETGAGIALALFIGVIFHYRTGGGT